MISRTKWSDFNFPYREKVFKRVSSVVISLCIKFHFNNDLNRPIKSVLYGSHLILQSFLLSSIDELDMNKMTMIMISTH